MQQVTIKVTPHTSAQGQLLIPTGFCDSYVACTGIKTDNTRDEVDVFSDFGHQKAKVLTPADESSPVQIRYQFEPTGKSLPEQFFEQQTNRYTVASQGFAEEIKALNTEGNPAKQIFDLILKAKSVFDYGHADERFNDGQAQVPALCGTTKGSCVDINTYLIAASNSLGIPVQYVAGYWFHPERNFTPDMHCWLLFNVDNTVIPWDLAHHLKWGVSELSPSLNPAGGRRVPMSFGRGLNFEGPHGTVQISHFSEPVWLLPNGQTEDSILEISIQD